MVPLGSTDNGELLNDLHIDGILCRMLSELTLLVVGVPVKVRDFSLGT